MERLRMRLHDEDDDEGGSEDEDRLKSKRGKGLRDTLVTDLRIADKLVRSFVNPILLPSFSRLSPFHSSFHPSFHPSM